MVHCEGPGGTPGSNVQCPNPQLDANFCQGDMWLCDKCESSRFGQFKSYDGNLDTRKEVISDEVFHDVQETLPAELKIGSLIFAKSNKTYPNWPGKIVMIHANRQTCLVEFFHTQNWILTSLAKLHRYENLATYRQEASKSKLKNEFETAINEANIYSVNIKENESPKSASLYPNLQKENVEEISVLGKVFNEVKDQSLEDTSNSLHKRDGGTASVLTCHCNRDKKSVDVATTKIQATKPVCKKFVKGTCPHGISGKSLVGGNICKYEHPKRCKSYCKFGPRHRFGCSKGTECSLLHPALCKSSVNTRTCYTLDCKFTHLKGTRRRKTSPTNSPTVNQSRPSALTHPSTNHRQNFSNDSTGMINVNGKRFTPPDKWRPTTESLPEQNPNDAFLGAMLSQMRQLITQELDSFKNQMETKMMLSQHQTIQNCRPSGNWQTVSPQYYSTINNPNQFC